MREMGVVHMREMGVAHMREMVVVHMSYVAVVVVHMNWMVEMVASMNLTNLAHRMRVMAMKARCELQEAMAKMGHHTMEMELRKLEYRKRSKVRHSLQMVVQ